MAGGGALAGTEAGGIGQAFGPGEVVLPAVGARVALAAHAHQGHELEHVHDMCKEALVQKLCSDCCTSVVSRSRSIGSGGSGGGDIVRVERLLISRLTARLRGLLRPDQGRWLALLERHAASEQLWIYAALASLRHGHVHASTRAGKQACTNPTGKE